MLGIEMIGLCGAILNLSCVPERYFHGKLDCFFNSHNIMHLLVLLGPLLLHSGIVMDFEWMKNAKCPV
jgi:predicted membrane channel-forming protein YqfA (hemolysin III family)